MANPDDRAAAAARARATGSATRRDRRRGRRGDARRGPGDRRRPGRGRRHGGLHRPHEQREPDPLRLRPPRDDRGDRGAGHRSSAARASPIAVDHLDPDAGASAWPNGSASDYGHIDVLVNDIWGGEVLKGGPAEWNTPIWEHDLDNGLRILRLAIDTHLITSHHLLPLLIDRPGGLLVEVTDGTTAYNASALPDLGVLRPGQGGGEPAGLLPGPRARAPRRDRGRHHARLAALGDDARRTSASPRRTGATRLGPGRRRPLASPRRSRPATSAAPSPRWPPIPTAPAGTSSRSPPASWRPSTGSPTSTARSPTSGATELRDGGGLRGLVPAMLQV